MNDPRLSIDAGLLAELEQLRRGEQRPSWLADVLRELLELEHQATARDVHDGENLTALERIEVVYLILSHEQDDGKNDLAYAREQLDVAAALLRHHRAAR